MNTKPIQIDLLVIRKSSNVIIYNAIGKIHEWLKALTSNMSIEEAKRIIISMNHLTEKDDKENADSVIQLALTENPDMFEKVKEVPEMCEALQKLMKPEIDAAVNAAVDAAVTNNRIAMLSEAIANGGSDEDLKRLHKASDDEIQKARDMIAFV